MKRFMIAAFVVTLAAIVSLAFADRSLRTTSTQRAPIRQYVGATVQQYDTLAVSEGERVELSTFSIFADDSAMTPTLNVIFSSLVTKTVYLRLVESYTANQIKNTIWTGPWAFPKDSTILIYYNITGANPGTLDTLRAAATYRLEKM